MNKRDKLIDQVMTLIGESPQIISAERIIETVTAHNAGDNKTALGYLNSIDERECSLDAWNNVCNAISFFQSPPVDKAKE